MNVQMLYLWSNVWDLAVKAWSAIGPLIGVLIGFWLTRSWQRKQWVLESKKAEYRELISVLTDSFHCFLKNRSRFPVGTVGIKSTEEERREVREAWSAGQKIIEDRIFIQEQMRFVADKWSLFKALEEMTLADIHSLWQDIHDLLIKMAHRDLGIKPL